MTTIKKVYTEIHEILESNKGKKVKDVLELLMPLMTSQTRDKNHMEDEHGLWIFCYYHKEWELTTQVEYGTKVNTATGLNTMCKVGTNCWTKQQREFKKAKADLLDKVSVGDVSPEEVPVMIEELEKEKDKIVTLTDYYNALAYSELETEE